MAKDFRSKQIRTSKLIGSGGIAAGTPFLGLAVYDHRHAVNNAGTQKYDGTMQPSMLADVGRDVWMFVSGSQSYPQFDWQAQGYPRMLTGSAIGEPGYRGGKAVLFGGDVVISGTLFAERQVIEVDETVRGDLIVPNRAHVSQSLHVNQGAVFNISSGSTAYTTVAGVPVPNNDFVIHGSTVPYTFFVDASTNRIGIGDNAPDSLFSIKSTTVNALADVGNAANYHLRLEGATTDGHGVGISFGNSRNSGASIIFEDTAGNAVGDLEVYTKNNTNMDGDPEQRMIIKSDGKIGIGEDGSSYDFAPDALLEIYGTTTQLKLSNNAADYSTLGVGTNGDLTITTVDAAAGAANFVVVADGAVDIDANAGALSLDGSTGINIGTEADVAIDIDSSTLDIDASGAITIDGGSTLSIDAVDDSNLTVTASGKDLDIAVAGGSTQELRLTSAGTGASALKLNATAGAIDVDAAGKIQILSGDDSDFLVADTKTLFLGEGVDNAQHTMISITHDASTVTNEKILIQNNAGTQGDAIRIKSSAGGVWIDSDSTDLDAVNIDSAGGIDVDSAGAINIDTSANYGHIAITSAHTAGDAITISANADAGSILDIDAGIMDVDVQGAYTLDASGVSIDSDAASNFSTSAGDITIDAAAASLNLLGGEADAAAVRIQADNAAGGIDIDAGTAGVHVDTTGAISLDSTYNNGGAINITTNAGTSEKIVIQNTQGNTEASASDGAVQITASAGGVSIDAQKDIHLAADGGDIAFSDGTTTVMNFDVDNVAFKIMDDADTGDYFEIATAAAGATTITTVDDDAGAANLTFVIDGAVDVDANSGALSLDGSTGINIGTEADVAIDIDSSTLDIDASGAITIDGTSTLSIDSADDSNITVTGAGKHLTLSTAGGGAQRLELTSAGTGARAIDVTATAGGFDVDANGILALDSETRIDIGVAQDVPLDIDSSTLDIDASGAITIDGSSTISIDGSGALNIDTSSGALSVGTANSGIAVNIGHSTSEVTVGDNLTVQGNLTVNGVTTTVNSTTMTVDDPILTLGGDSAPGSDDNKDRGVEFRWHDGSDAKVGFFGFDDSTKEFTFVPEATNSSEVFSGEKGVINVQGVNFANDGALYGDAGSLRVTVPAGGDLVLSQSIGLVFGNAGEKIEGNGTDLTIQGGDINLTAEADVNIPAGVGLTFGNDAEKIEGDGTDLTISGNNINLTAVADVKVPANVGIMLGTHEKIESDDTDLNITVGAGGDVNLPANIGLTFGDDGEKIEGDGTDLTISGNNINLTAVADVVIPANVGVLFGSGEKIEGDNTDLTVTSGGAINLTAVTDVNIPSGVGLTFAATEKIESDGTDLSISVGAGGDVNLPADIGLTFGDDGEKIEGDGTDLTIASSNLLNLTATTDVVIPVNVGLILDGSGAEKIESDGTDINISVGASGDINIPANIGLTFGNDGEKIEGDGTDLTITGNNINLTATEDIVVPANVGITFGTGEKIEGDNTDLTVTSGGDIKLSAAAQVQIPASIPLTFDGAGGSDTISSDGTDMVIAASGGDITLDAGDDIVLDAAGGDIRLNRGGSARLRFDISTGVSYIQNGTDGSDIAFRVDAGATEIARFDDSASSFLMAGTKKIEFTDANAYINHDGTDLQIVDDADINLKPGADLLVDAGGDIKLDAAGADIDFLRDGVLNLRLNLYKNSNAAKSGVDILSKGFMVLRPESGEVTLMSGSNPNSAFGTLQGFNGDMYLSSSQSDKDMIFMVNDGGTMTEVIRLDGDVSALKVAAGKQVQFGNANVSLSNSTVSGKENDLTLASHLLNVTSEETYYTGDVFVSGTFTPNALSLNNLDLAANGYLRFGDANNFIQRSGNDLQFRDTATGATKTLTELMTVSGIGPFEVLSTEGPATLKVRSTGSFSLGANNQYADVVGSDVFFYISGSVDRGSSSDIKAAAFGGDVVITGSLKAGAKIDTWSYDGANHFYSLSASMEEVGFQAPLVGKNVIGSDVLSILPGYDINKSANNSLVSILGEVSDGNIIFGVNDGGTATEVMRLQGNNASLRMNASKNLEFGGTSRYINSANTTAINYVNSNTAGAHVFTGHIRPAANNTYDLGAETLRFRNIYTGDLNLKNERGDWTILEEEDFLCVINNKTGKKFKMMLEPIEENE